MANFRTGTLGDLAVQFTLLSLVAFGGANAVVPEIHRLAVGLRHWTTDAEFARLFAIANAAPGPNVMISTLVGWKAAGIPGAIVATLAMCGPTCVLTYFVSRAWERWLVTRLGAAIGAGLTPVTVGFIGASALLLSRGADTSWRLAIVTVATALVAWRTKLNPLWCLAAAAGLGLAGALG